jgi:phosphoribosyl-ATP pyrophosphohydrolase/phosphoribosyl-AMP cyclohydrolase
MDLPVSKETVDLAKVRYDAQTGLVPVVVQDADTGRVLTLAYANREAIKRTLATKETWFWSRSRAEYWHKGATSGNIQQLVDVRMDCDGDAVLYLVRPVGPACHTGEESCFHRSVSHVETSAGAEGEQAPVLSEVTVRSEANGYGSTDTLADIDSTSFTGLAELWSVIDGRRREMPEGSYTTYLFTHGAEKIGKKVGEEAVEVALSALRAELTGSASTVASESADLLYHLFVLWRSVGVSPDKVMQALADRK